jgi:energy-coupling factor transporter ATP-binding protein EcfA2
LENIRKKLKKLDLEENNDVVFDAIDDDPIILFSNRLAWLKKEKTNGLETPEGYHVRLSRLNENWINLVKELTNEQLVKVVPFLNLDTPNEEFFQKSEPIEQLVKAAPSLPLNTSNEEFSQKLQTASALLSQWKSEFENTNNTHLDRKETSQLLDWINTPLSNEDLGIVMLVGEAGSGKSVILRDLMLLLEEKDTPVLGIKADRYCVSKIQDLEARLHLEEGIEVIVKTLVRNKGQVVVLIDQIDALSQSLSAQRDYLDTFIQLIKALSYIEGVRIVISCRKYDIENDQDFSFYRRQKTFTVGKLADEDIKLVLDKLPCTISSLPNNLKNLLSVPLQLDVFCRIYRPDFPFQKMHTLKDLFDDLWLQKIEQIENLPPLSKKHNF